MVSVASQLGICGMAFLVPLLQKYFSPQGPGTTHVAVDLRFFSVLRCSLAYYKVIAFITQSKSLRLQREKEAMVSACLTPLHVHVCMRVCMCVEKQSVMLTIKRKELVAGIRDAVHVHF